MLALLRSDWFQMMLAGFAIGGIFILTQQSAIASVL